MMTDTHAVIGGLVKAAGLISQRGIAKDRKNENQGFRFRGIDDVYNSLSAILVEAELVCVPEVLERSSHERVTRKPRNDGSYTESVLLFETVKIRYTVFSSVDGSSVTGVGIGQAMDAGDKALNKAQSAAFKYFFFQLLCIPTEGDNDADATTHTGLVPTPPPEAPAAPAGIEAALAALDNAGNYPAFAAAWAATPPALREYIAVHEHAFLQSLKTRLGK